MSVADSKFDRVRFFMIEISASPRSQSWKNVLYHTCKHTIEELEETKILDDIYNGKSDNNSWFEAKIKNLARELWEAWSQYEQKLRLVLTAIVLLYKAGFIPIVVYIHN